MGNVWVATRENERKFQERQDIDTKKIIQSAQSEWIDMGVKSYYVPHPSEDTQRIREYKLMDCVFEDL